MSSRFHPKLLTVLSEGYSREEFLGDLQAGLTVGLVALPLPLAIAFAIASGVEPARGLFTAIVAGFLISALGGSRVQIGGPTGAFIVIVYAVVARHGYDGLAVATLLAGIIIAASQGRDFFGLSMEAVPPDFLEKIAEYAHHASSMNPWALSIGAGTIGVSLFWPRVTRRVPGPLAGGLAADLWVRYSRDRERDRA
ncbi:MAG: hypothetical protein COY42_27385 [Armatimonadetes bacterium CG_4_10_14_0_8_um_filter_66_14]|nr:MAG: hypothetical protein AUJ52_05060 [Elusimicrobia bacterium CG1_02_63_36]PIP83328.1 MAG: hypothetical protein COR54_10200 [Elusimicrobia bacterium CG22_combo_CG10-13_8_21_14_all_63_91]PIZ35129.1 MAG: hypothetical protein COY42_27385 [Armatimonadetes bacterium CG_4_10_14_0_8_um_filter_66_14]PJA17969.1 MAG: hypothetical protein COX66_02835 [Elusimicrobia bacterium CG_4_10_14_0_2_um_filter_63_34]PJB26396.1 MAG: hypothetical protein CO113_03730 [Elusimicrobia bacterium CG_4_9_14_3_um_filter_6